MIEVYFGISVFFIDTNAPLLQFQKLTKIAAKIISVKIQSKNAIKITINLLFEIMTI